VLQRTPAQIRVKNSPNGRGFKKLFEGTSAEVELIDDFLSATWRKLCLNAAGALSALTLKLAGVLQYQAVGLVALEIVAECVAVGRAAGYRAGAQDSINSFLAGRMAGRQTEIDAPNGVIVWLGEKYGIATPEKRMAVALMNAM